jgi:diguanylate cyclase (GGDEF)-like protein
MNNQRHRTLKYSFSVNNPVNKDKINSMVITNQPSTKHLTDLFYNKILTKPLPLLITVLSSIFITETIIMLVISNITPLSIITEAIVDSFLLVVVLYPLLHFLIIRPLRLEITKRKTIEEKLREYHNDLGSLVNERTTELLKANEKLQRENIERKQLEEELRTASITDILTGLMNRRGFFSIAKNQCEIAGRNNLNLTFLFLDLDKMKEINDKFSHKVGDLALIDTADILKKSFRDSDTIARFGGDEFVVMVMENPETNIEILTKRLKTNLNAFNKETSRAYKLSFSFGLTRFKPEKKSLFH